MANNPNNPAPTPPQGAPANPQQPGQPAGMPSFSPQQQAAFQAAGINPQQIWGLPPGTLINLMRLLLDMFSQKFGGGTP